MSTAADVQTRYDRVSVAEVRTYLASRGWKLKHCQRPHTLLFEYGTDDDGKTIVQVFPDSEHYSDYTRCVEDLVRSLSIVERRSTEEVLKDLLEDGENNSGNLQT